MKIHHLIGAVFVTLFLLVAFVAPHPSNITVHEWGTFTSIAGHDGLAMEWLPITGSPDLPSFVEHLANANLKGGLRGRIRMETPVLYFYSPQEATVSVHVSFEKGLITEWYPHAAVPSLDPRRDFALVQKHTEGAITWNSVQIHPGTGADFPADDSTNHYYAARLTSSAPLTINGSNGAEHEKFLFYRGVSAVLPPLTSTVTSDTNILFENHFPAAIPDAILFERRGTKVGYRILGLLQDQVSFASPTLDGSLDALFSDLEGILVSQGLYADEAHAMVETWESSWFEEGSRVLYIVPRPFVDSVLPLTINPEPQQITRVFVGRLELVTPATQQAVVSAFASNDQATLAKYNRFLDPILRYMIDSSTDQTTRNQLMSCLNSALSHSYAKAQD